MSRLAHRWRTLRTAIRNANCTIQWVIEILNAYCTFGLFLGVCLYQCLFLFVPVFWMHACIMILLLWLYEFVSGRNWKLWLYVWMNEIYSFDRMYNPYLLKEIYAKQEFWPLCKCILNTTVTSWKWISQCSICMSFVCVLKIILFVWETTLQKRL